MPGLARKILIFAAVDGLVLTPLAQRGQPRPAPAIQIAYSDNHIRPALRDGAEPGKGFEAFGIVGLLTVSSSSFLISITRRQQVAQIRGKPVYVITEVALTPLSSKTEAEAAVARTRTALTKGKTDGEGSEESDSEAEDIEASAAISDDVEDEEPSHHGVLSGAERHSEHKRTSSVAEDVISRKGGYGRFARGWFSKNMGAVPKSPIDLKQSSQSPIRSSTPTSVKEEVVEGRGDQNVAKSLLPKLLRTAQVLFGSSRSFYFSYDLDITRSLGSQRPTSSELPLHTQVDPLYFWNRHVIQPVIDAGQSSFVLPLLQGFVGQRSFEMSTNPPKPVLGLDGADRSSMEMSEFHAEKEEHTKDTENSEKSFFLTLISRRSVKRGGLRYLRRGVDEDGNTANGVETEQILSDASWDSSSKIHSFVQIRGSIPIFFSQTPYSFKPVPQLQHSPETTYKAFKKHFDSLADRYGSVQVASLVEKHGNEAIVGDVYEQNMQRLNEEHKADGKTVGWEWFDFHAMCRGMKFENVNVLMETLGDKLDSFGVTVEADGKTLSKQSGILRTNCMDCLDRTNVVQSACGRRALELHLKSVGIEWSLQKDLTWQFFNTLWADNGDAVSKQYASTAALKGDFTRTRKRDYKGALTDMGLSITRFYNGIVNDYFSQAAIDFLLGNVTDVIFEDFEANLMSSDPAVSMQKMRQQAIEVSQKIVIADESEEFLGGWTLLTPHDSNTIKSTLPFEEAVLLLTDSAIYATRFDWNIEKVISFERVDLKNIQSLKYGTYITSTLSASQTDEKRNVGFVVTYEQGKDSITRVNTRTLSSRDDADLLGGTSVTGLPTLVGQPPVSTTRVLAWKALPARSAAVVEGMETTQHLSEIESVKTICAEIERVAAQWRVGVEVEERKGLAESGDVVSLVEAKRSTGILEQLGHSLKKMVWA